MSPVQVFEREVRSTLNDAISEAELVRQELEGVQALFFSRGQDLSLSAREADGLGLLLGLVVRHFGEVQGHLDQLRARMPASA